MQLVDSLLADANVSSTVIGRSLRIHHILSLGGAGTGVGFHLYDENHLVQVQGRKTWSLAAPGTNTWQGHAMHGCDLHKLSTAPNVPKERRPPLACTVDPGEAIYIPGMWHHATCNLDALTLSLGGQGDIGDSDESALIRCGFMRVFLCGSAVLCGFVRVRFEFGFSCVSHECSISTAILDNDKITTEALLTVKGRSKKLKSQ